MFNVGRFFVGKIMTRAPAEAKKAIAANETTEVDDLKNETHVIEVNIQPVELHNNKLDYEGLRGLLDIVKEFCAINPNAHVERKLMALEQILMTKNEKAYPGIHLLIVEAYEKQIEANKSQPPKSNHGPRPGFP